MNYVAVLVAGIISMIIGGFWYSPAGFGKTWVKLSGMTNKQLSHAKKKGMAWSYVFAFVAALLTNWVFAQVLTLSGATSVSIGMLVGFSLWLGFIATTLLSSLLWEQKPLRLYLINAGHYLLVFLINGALLSVWQ